MDKLYPRLNALHKALRGSPLDKEAFRFYADALHPFEWQEVDRAIQKHAETSRFFPSPAEILDRIPRTPSYSGPHINPDEYVHQREWREQLAQEFKALPAEQKARLRKAFMQTANNFTKRRIEDVGPEKLANNLAFRIFLESRIERESGNADSDGRPGGDSRREAVL